MADQERRTHERRQDERREDDDRREDERRKEDRRRNSIELNLIEPPSRPSYSVSGKFLGWLGTLLGIVSTLIFAGWVVGNALFVRKDDHALVEQRNAEKTTDQQVFNAKIQSGLERIIEKQEQQGKMLGTVNDNLRKINIKLKIE